MISNKRGHAASLTIQRRCRRCHAPWYANQREYCGPSSQRGSMGMRPEMSAKSRSARG